jgi:SAM-dependent methyltransferase
MQLENLYRREDCCRSCGSDALKTQLDLGMTPLADRLLTAEQLNDDEPSCPLTLVFCTSCSLVQIRETVRPDILFGDDYPYYSSVSPALLSHFSASVNEILDRRSLGPQSLIVELASNDGYLLQNYVSHGIPVLGIDPAPGPASVAQSRGVSTRVDFFTRELAKTLSLEGVQADIIHANNVIAHVADSNGFVAGIAEILKPDGEAVIECPYVGDLIDNCEFDTIYHQHLCYFSLHSLQALCARHGLFINHVTKTSIHGGSIRVFMHKHNSPDRSVEKLLMEEAQSGMLSENYYKSFAKQISLLTGNLSTLVKEIIDQGHTIAGYGAAAKACTLLSYAGIDQNTLPYIVDRNSFKHGRFMPGSRIPIKPVEWLQENPPDYLLLLSWNFANEIMQQLSEYEAQGGKFIVPIPEPRIVSNA